jgi:hypothetical protein
MNKKQLAAIGAALATATAGTAFAAQGGTQAGPSSSQSPYVVPTAKGVKIESLITVGDSVNEKWDNSTPYRYVGIPDGQGAFDNGDGTFTLLSNHELPGNRGIARDHGAAGSFVSRWTIDKETFEVLDGEDLIKQVATWNGSGWNAPGSGVALSRLCSADLALRSAFFNPETKRGYPRRILLSGEEAGTEGRGFAHFLGGRSFEIPAVGKMSFENVVANPGTGNRTVTVSLDDSTPGELYVYAGDKTKRGNAVQRAGLDNGSLFGVAVEGYPAEDVAAGIPSGTRFTGFDHGDVRAKSGADLQAESTAGAVTKFRRPEDGAWDPQDPNVFYFVTTASFNEPSRLWRLTFDDARDPGKGGVIDMLLDGSEGQRMFDNMTIDARGRRIIIQEDPGNNSYLAAVWSYDVRSDTLTKVAQHDPARFVAGAPGYLGTQDEESSGVIDASQILGRGWYLGNSQIHLAHPDAELVEHGQMWAMYVPDNSGRDEAEGR